MAALREEAKPEWHENICSLIRCYGSIYVRRRKKVSHRLCRKLLRSIWGSPGGWATPQRPGVMGSWRHSSAAHPPELWVRSSRGLSCRGGSVRGERTAEPRPGQPPAATGPSAPLPLLPPPPAAPADWPAPAARAAARLSHWLGRTPGLPAGLTPPLPPLRCGTRRRAP